ncbi:MAG: hypothetical protein E6G35_00185, partial [Actinobacteria bacterium]
MGDPGGTSSIGCQCAPSLDVQTAGPSWAPVSAEPIATNRPSAWMSRCTRCGPGPSRPVAGTRCQCVPSPERRTATSPAGSVDGSAAVARNPAPVAVTAVSSVTPGTGTSVAVHESPAVPVHTVGWWTVVPVQPTATSREPLTARSLRTPVPGDGGATGRQPAPPCRTQARGSRSREFPTATRSPEPSTATAFMASGPGGSVTSWPVSRTVPAWGTALPGRLGSRAVPVSPPGFAVPRMVSATIPATTRPTTTTTIRAVRSPRPQYPSPGAPVRTTTGSSRSVTTGRATSGSTGISTVTSIASVSPAPTRSSRSSATVGSSCSSTGADTGSDTGSGTGDTNGVGRVVATGETRVAPAIAAPRLTAY